MQKVEEQLFIILKKNPSIFNKLFYKLQIIIFNNLVERTFDRSQLLYNYKFLYKQTLKRKKSYMILRSKFELDWHH